MSEMLVMAATIITIVCLLLHWRLDYHRRYREGYRDGELAGLQEAMRVLGIPVPSDDTQEP